MYNFSLNDSQIQKYSEWVVEQDLKAVEMQKQQIKNPTALVKSCWEAGFPYTGAIDGGTTFSFTPTSLGIVSKAHYALTGDTLDLTEWELW